MKYNRNQNSYEELQTIVEAHLETIEKLRTKLHKFRVLALDEELFAEAMKEASEGGEETTETFKLPEKWCIEVTTNNIAMLSEWRGDKNLYNGGSVHGYLRYDSVWIPADIDDTTLITDEQFLQFVYTPFLASEGGKEKTEFTLDRNEIYSLEGTTEEQREKLYQWLLKNDIGWEQGCIQSDDGGIVYDRKEWKFYWGGRSTKYIKDLI